MRNKKDKIVWGRAVSSLLMMLALVWLTVSSPFVYAAQQQKSAVEKQQCENNPEDDCNNPLGNTTEEKSEKGVNTLSEYLHDTHTHEAAGNLITKIYKCHPSDLYFAYHPDLFSPPPEEV
jgi:hypothetical protein